MSPHLVALHFFHPQSVDALLHQFLAALPSQTQEIQDCSRVNSSYAGSSPNGATFHEVLQNAHGLFFGQDHVAEWPVVTFREGLFASLTAIPL
jgi:hypothetical protein